MELTAFGIWAVTEAIFTNNVTAHQIFQTEFIEIVMKFEYYRAEPAAFGTFIFLHRKLIIVSHIIG